MTQLNLVGTTLGRFEIISEEGKGGMALVYKARQTDLDRIVALKIMRPELAHDADIVARFHQEARSAARLEHPHIIPIYDIGELEAPGGTHLHYIAMKYVQGRTIKELLEERRRLDIPEALAILAQVGGALAYAHQHSVIHRDVKPSNMLLANDGTVYLSDFGLAYGLDTANRLTKTGMVMGTPEYMSPEQAEGKIQVGPATDIYALGIVLYEMLTDGLPFEAETPMAMVVARLMNPPRPLLSLRDDLPPQVETIVARALARQPEERFASIDEFLDALHNLDATAMEETERTTRALYAIPANTGETLVAEQQGDTPQEEHHSPEEKPDQPDQGNESDENDEQWGVDEVPPAERKKKRNNALIWGGIAAVLAALLCLPLSGFALFGAFRAGPPQPTPIVLNPTPVTPRETTRPHANREVEALLERGWTAFDEERYNDAEASFAEAIGMAGHLAEPHYGLGLVYYEQGRFEEAVNQLKEAVRSEPRSAELHLASGDAYYAVGETARSDEEAILALQIAQAEYERAASAPPGSIHRMDMEDVRLYAHTGSGWANFYLADYDEARRAFRAAIDIDDEEAEAYNGLGWTLFTLQEHEAALDAFEKAEDILSEEDDPERDEEYANVLYGLGLTLEEFAEYDDAREAYEDALEFDPGNEEIARQLEGIRLR